MTGLVSYHLRIIMEALAPIRLSEYKGAAVRGAWIGALRRHYCTAPVRLSKAGSAHAEECPACSLIAAEDEERSRGRNPPRAYVIDPPLDTRTRYAPGDRLAFGLGIFSEAISLYPYLLTALSLMGDEGIGGRLSDNGGRRGRLALRQIQALNPLTREQVLLFQEGDSSAAGHLALPVTHELVLSEASRWPTDQITVRFLTPTRITAEGRLVQRADFVPIFQRLLERIIELWETYAGERPPLDAPVLLREAASIRCLADETHWVDLDSASERTGRRVPIGGIIGSATYTGNLAPLIPWLLWGKCLHVGKNAVKGDGWYELLP